MFLNFFSTLWPTIQPREANTSELWRLPRVACAKNSPRHLPRLTLYEEVVKIPKLVTSRPSKSLGIAEFRGKTTKTLDFFPFWQFHPLLSLSIAVLRFSRLSADTSTQEYSLTVFNKPSSNRKYYLSSRELIIYSLKYILHQNKQELRSSF